MAGTLTAKQRDTVVRTVIGEAANQGARGQIAVASVIRNRAQSGQFSSDPAKVALQPGQFSTWNSISERARVRLWSNSARTQCRPLLKVERGSEVIGRRA